MGKPSLLVSLAALAVACALGAAVIPAGAYVSHITVDSDLGAFGGSSLVVHIDRHDVVVHTPDGLVIASFRQEDSPPTVTIALAPLLGRDPMLVRFVAGPAPRAQRQVGEVNGAPIYVVRHGRAVSWELLDGATVIVASPTATQEQMLQVLDLIEIDPRT